MSCHMVLKIATTGLVVSCLLHLATFTDYDFPGEVADKILLVLFLGLMTVWIPTYQVGKRLRERLPSAGSGPPASASRAPLEIPHCGVHMVLLYCCGSSNTLP